MIVTLSKDISVDKYSSVTVTNCFIMRLEWRSNRQKLYIIIGNIEK
jgi:hypothetical protein